MDKALFLGMNAEQSAMHQIEILTNNLANASTPGFRADYEIVKQHAITSSNMGSRVYSSVGETYTDFKQGPTLRTGRDLDVAIAGEGFFAVQSRNGKEGYTRAGNFQLSKDGFLTTQTGEMVLGMGGVINIPSAEKIHIGNDGTISARYIGTSEMVQVGRLKLINSKPNELAKGHDGLFYMKNSGNAPISETVKLTSGALEGSNVNSIDTLTKLIDISRHYEMHSNFIKNLTELADSQNKLLNIER